MIKSKAIDHINLVVKSVNNAKDFYTKHFAMEVFEEYSYKSSETQEEIKFLLIGNSGKLMLCLYEYELYDFDKSPLSHIGINVGNFEGALEYARINDLLDLDWEVIEHKNSKSFYVVDPNGLNIEISENFGGGN